jgi:L-amino acid N-acyltransferase YncA
VIFGLLLLFNVKLNPIMPEIRCFQPGDSTAILDIYAPFILNSAVSFEESVPNISDFEKRLKVIADKYPFFVFSDNREILGYAYGTKHRERAAYRWIVETTIYMHHSATGKGLGKLLYETLLAELINRNFTLAYGIITLPNDGSVQLHKSCGFSEMVIHTNAGWKNGQWNDVIWMKKELNPVSNPPLEPNWSK